MSGKEDVASPTTGRARRVDSTSYIAYERQTSTSAVGLPIAGTNAPRSPVQAIQD